MSRRFRAGAILGMVAFVTLGATVAPAAAAEADPEQLSRTDHSASGNRLVSAGSWSPGVIDIALGAVPQWVLPDPGETGNAWLVTMPDGSVLRVSPNGASSSGGFEAIATLESGTPPIARSGEGGTLRVGSALDAQDWFDDAIPAARAVHTPGGQVVALTGSTQRYPHGVLGDDIEATTISIRDVDGSLQQASVDDGEVIEGLTPMLADLDLDGVVEIIVTVSTADAGARVVVFDLEGRRIASSEPIGRGFRWLHQVAVGPLAADGKPNVVVVRTPHIGGIVQAFELNGARLDLVAESSGFSSHRLGSPNLDMALLADVDADAVAEVIVPHQDRRSLAVLARRGDRFVPTRTLPLDGELATNVAAAVGSDGALRLAIGTDDGRLRIFG